MGMIKSERQLAAARKALAALQAAVRKLRAKYKGDALRLFSAGPLGMISDLEEEIRDYAWLRKSTPARVIARYGRIRLEDLGPFLARLRIASGLTQAALAKRVGTRQPDIARLEDVDYPGPSAATLKAVARALGVEFLLGARPLPASPRVG